MPVTQGISSAPLAEAWGKAAGKTELMGLLDNAQGRIAIPPAQNRRVWDAVPGTATASLAAEAAVEKGKPWPQPLVSHYSRYFRDGNRTAYEALVHERQDRLTRAVVMTTLAGGQGSDGQGPEGQGTERQGSLHHSQEWLDEVIDGAFLLCEQSSWCWASHDDVHARLGHVVPDRSRPYLDLGAGEVAAQLAWLDHVLADSLDTRAPGLRERIREEVLERVIRPFLDRTDWHWLGLDGHVHNWNPWIHSNILVAALFLVEDRELQATTVGRVIEGLDRFLAAIPSDGAIDEGFSYWWNGAGRALEALSLLEEASGGVLAGDIPVVRALVSFPQRMHIGGRWFLNVADGPALAHRNLPWNLVRRWARRLGDEDAARHAEALAVHTPDAAAGLGWTLRALLEPAADPAPGLAPGPSGDAAEGPAVAPPPTPPLTSFTYLDSVQIMLARETRGTTRGLLLTAKGGHNGENHNHKDVGSVTVAVDGVPLLVDAGQPTYTAQTFGPNRYDIRAMQSGWHNVPAPFGLEQGAGASFGAHVAQRPTPENPRLVLELAGAYGLAREGRWTRTALLDRVGSRAVIEDSWTLPGSPSATLSPAQSAALSPALSQELPTPDVDIHYLLAGTATLGPQGTATVFPEGIPEGIPARDAAGAAQPGVPGRGAVLRWNQPAAVVLVDEWLLDDPLLAQVWGTRLTRLRFRMPAPLRAAGTFTLTVEATP